MNWTPEAKTFSKACFDGIVDAVFPPRCCICHEIGRPAICTDCAPELKALPMGSCERCAIDSAGEAVVCHWMSAVDMLRGAFDYRGAAGVAVKQLKFGRVLEAAIPMGKFLTEIAEELSFDYAAPVPIHWSRKSHRGFNQAELLARQSG
jgi:predicted amidophosphoribosyltransferase